MRSLLLLLPLALAAQNYDIVMSDGRVMDPSRWLLQSRIEWHHLTA
jgi:hypothetical protein